MKTMQHMVGNNKGRLHLIFCIFVLCILFIGMYMLNALGFQFHGIVAAITDCFFFLFCIYVGRWICITYLTKKLFAFISISVSAITALALIKWLLYKYLFNHRFAGFFELTRDVMPFFLIAVVLGMLLKFVSVFVQKELQNAYIQTKQKEMELGLLQAQLSPHFLFNVLNNLYGISLDEQNRIPPLLLKLSNLLRYSLYGAKKTFVPLQEELDYINHYIEFEKIRISDRLIIETKIEKITDQHIVIAPLLFIVFVENAFKHARNSFEQKIYIKIELKISGEFICFKVSNSYRKEACQDDIVNESSGLGLANTIKRLELLYANNYKLKQYDDNGQYIVELNLNYVA